MKKHLNFLIIVVIILSGFFFANYRIVQDKALIIYNWEQDTKMMVPVPNQEFTMGYLHSVHKTPVLERFFIEENNGLQLQDVVYESLGVGMPYTHEDGVFFNDDGKFILSFNRTYDLIPIRVSSIPDHFLEVGDVTYPLTRFARPNERIEISATDRWSIRTISRKEK